MCEERKTMSSKSATYLDKKLFKATEYLKSRGAKEIILVGPLADGTFDSNSDIDLAV
jgi:predicted nucleotidyltransferase